MRRAETRDETVRVAVATGRLVMLAVTFFANGLYGSILPLVNQGATLPSGASVLTLVPAQALPGGLPTIDLVIEAAILEPVLGVTLSRHNGTLHLLP